jgi:large subunit ribosomal protein L23
MKPTEVIRRPLVTEKTTIARESGGGQVVVFEVATQATKVDIRRAVEKLFGTKVASVRTQIGHGKFKRQGRFEGQRPDRKKAWVRLKAGEKAPDFVEGT